MKLRHWLNMSRDQKGAAENSMIAHHGRTGQRLAIHRERNLNSPQPERVVLADRRNVMSIGFITVVNKSWIHSYRAREGLSSDDAEPRFADAEWSSIGSDVTIDEARRQYGDRLLAYNENGDDWVVEILAWDVIDSSTRTVRVLLSKE